MSLSDVISLYQTGQYRIDRRVSGARSGGHYTPSPYFEMDVASVSGSHLVVTAHGLATGFGPLWVSSSGDVPTPTDPAVEYWAIVVDADTLELAVSKANAEGDVPVTLTDVGTGTIHLGTHFTLNASIQPASDDELQDLPEAQMNKDISIVWSIAELMYGRQAGYDPDVITYRGDQWRAFKGSYFGVLDSFYRTYVEKVNVP